MKIIDELIDSNEELTIDDKDHLKLLFSGFSKIFSKRPGTLVNHKINTGDAKPVVCKSRPMSPAERKIFQNAVDELIELVIFPPKNDDGTMGLLKRIEIKQTFDGLGATSGLRLYRLAS
ncbi:unnamed protein product [Allacma fusca]|uniref:Uncharacterized protein n=1 Tax=Allacma fusca TaxID=39272 RepID=A0A8J2JFV7_9HEXA|nr:unnamed protein product [Allacma fusca]